jgi:hypothetical protein
MGFAHWLRTNSEHYLLDDARVRVGTRYGASAAPGPDRGISVVFWRKVFVPAYRLLPWRFRLWVIRQMPGSHRKTWAPAPQRRSPGI